VGALGGASCSHANNDVMPVGICLFINHNHTLSLLRTERDSLYLLANAGNQRVDK